MSKNRHVPVSPDLFAIALRGHVRLPEQPKDEKKQRGRKQPGPSRWALIFDFETTIDEAQRPRIGAYQVRKDGEKLEEGVMYDPDAVSPDELATLRAYVRAKGLVLLPLAEFTEDVFFRVGYDYRATIIGFNLPFDLSRMAIEHSASRPHERRRKPDPASREAAGQEVPQIGGRFMVGGFSLKVSPHAWRPRVQVKYLSRRAALIRFAAAASQRATRWQAKRGEYVKVRRGFFADVKTLAAAFLSEGFTLERLAETLRVEHPKLSAKHGGPITPDYIRYNMQDVQTTWECYAVLAERYTSYGLNRTHLHRIMSEASLGKAHLKEMNIRPFREVQPDFPPDFTGKIMSAYYGGRSEVHLRRVKSQVLATDFLSMYPTVCTLMGLWRFVIAKGMTWRDSAEETRTFLERVEPENIRERDTWKRFPVLVEVEPEEDVFPVRAEYGRAQYAIGANYLTNDRPQWFALSDCIAAKFLSKKTPRVLRVITFEPGPVQDGLREILIAGNPAYPVNPATVDFYRRLIDMRKEVQAKMAATEDEAERATLDVLQQSLKILANATSYGIFVELMVEDIGKRHDLPCYGADADCFSVPLDKCERPGAYFHPLLAALITSAARLMLATAERLTIDEGLDWAFCDTDSIAIARPDGMDEETFYAKALKVSEWFTPLNPYAVRGPLLKVEDLNYAHGDKAKKLHPLFCYAISAKRYALFNIDERSSAPIMRKVSRHGLGHLLAPYADHEAPADFPAPTIPLKKLKVRRWQHDIWYRIVATVLAAPDAHFNAADHPAFRKPAASQYAATTPHMLRWFDLYNIGRRYAEQVRPFNFLLAYQSKRNLGTNPIRIVAPFRDNPSDAISLCINRDTGELVKSPMLATYEEVLAKYHLHSEAKFENGDEVDRGPTRRRHVRVSSVRYIGKEANRWEEQFFLGYEPDAQLEYGIAPKATSELVERVRSAAKAHGKRAVAAAAGVSARRIADVLAGKARVTPSMAIRLAHAIPRLEATRQARAANEQGRRDALRQACVACGGIRKLAITLEVDPTNLSKVLSGKRPVSSDLVARLEFALVLPIIRARRGSNLV